MEGHGFLSEFDLHSDPKYRSHENPGKFNLSPGGSYMIWALPSGWHWAATQTSETSHKLVGHTCPMFVKTVASTRLIQCYSWHLSMPKTWPMGDVILALPSPTLHGNTTGL